MRATFLLFAFLFTVFAAQGQNAWTQLNDFPFNLWGGSSFVFEGEAYIIVADDVPDQNSIYKYDVNSDSWSLYGGIASGLEEPFVLGDYVYFVQLINDGYDGLALHRLDITSNTYEQLSNVVDSYSSVFDYPDPETMIIDGVSYAYLPGAEDNFLKYDSVLDEWENVANTPFYRDGRTSTFSIDNKGYVIFGYQDAGDFDIDELWEYNSNTDAWTQRASYPTGNRPGAAIFVLNGEAYVGTGTEDYYLFTYSSFYRYDPSDDSWELIEPCGYDTRFSYYFAIDNVGYVLGGQRYSDYSEEEPEEYYSQKEVWRLDTELLSLDGIESTSISVYPNPTSNDLRINNLPENSFIALYDIQGKQIRVDSHGTSLSVNHLSSGVYFLKVSSDTSEQVIKFVKR